MSNISKDTMISGFNVKELLTLYGRAWVNVIHGGGTPYMKTVELEREEYKLGQKEYSPTRFVLLAKRHREDPNAVSIKIKEHGKYKKERILSKRDKRSYDINFENKEKYRKGDFTYTPERYETKFVEGLFGNSKLKYIETGEYMVIHKTPLFNPNND